MHGKSCNSVQYIFILFFFLSMLQFGYFLVSCHEPNVCVPLNLHIEALLSNVIIFGDGVFGRYLGPEGGAIMNGISAL